MIAQLRFRQAPISISFVKNMFFIFDTFYDNVARNVPSPATRTEENIRCILLQRVYSAAVAILFCRLKL